ncbi:MAG: hypothetical protein U1F70_04875 [Candidatus Competibacteraceae bacterium]
MCPDAIPHAYSKDQLVKQPAIGLFTALGWQTVSALEETFGPGGTLGRETKGEVVLAQRFKESKHKNTDLEVLKAAIRAQLENDDPVEPHPRQLCLEVRGADRELQCRQSQHRGAVRGIAQALQQPR